MSQTQDTEPTVDEMRARIVELERRLLAAQDEADSAKEGVRHLLHIQKELESEKKKAIRFRIMHHNAIEEAERLKSLARPIDKLSKEQLVRRLADIVASEKA